MGELAIDNDLSVSIFINGIKLSNLNSKISRLILSESISNEIASIQIDVLLRNEFMVRPVTDGSIVDFSVNFPSHIIGSSHKKVSRFRVYYYEAHEVSNEIGLQYSISAMVDSYYKLNTIEENVYDSTSSAVFQSIASMNNISSDTVGTNDKQIWFPADGNKINFLRHTCLHAWKDRDSVFCWWIDRYNYLCLKNFTDLIRGETKWIFIHNRKEDSLTKTNTILINSIRYLSSSGENNTAEGYGKLQTYFDTISNKRNTININNFYSGSEGLNINADVCKPMKYNQVGILSTNVHKNYIEAELQNKRGRTLYSVFVECYSSTINDVLLGDTVYYEMSLGSEIDVKIYTGKYIVIGIETSFIGRNCMTKYTLAKQGIGISLSGE